MFKTLAKIMGVNLKARLSMPPDFKKKSNERHREELNYELQQQRLELAEEWRHLISKEVENEIRKDAENYQPPTKAERRRKAGK